MIESKSFFWGVSELSVVLPVVIPVVISEVFPVVIPVVISEVFPVFIPVAISVVISETCIPVVSWSVVLRYVVSDICTITSFVYNQIKKMHTR